MAGDAEPGPSIRIAQDQRADEVLSQDPFALLVGMLLDQQFPMERAFAAPATVLERFGTLDPAAVAAADPEEFARLCSVPPAIHRFPGSMAGRIQDVARIVVERYDGDAARIWTGAADGADLLRRLQALPGFGRQKAQIFTALVAKQLGVTPDGWQQAAGDYALTGFRSVADVVDPDSLQQVRAHKQQLKRAAKAATADG
ncbi:HhH-GPD-type base excision DNA repair protein [Jannaschia sp. R86511]|uniref:HhH-GPD-type base excision DNA repair protein n=1 Tax=Jannaschia sp. R86511 TaxID=3093853 RepID=UPI0036D318D5